MIRAVLVFRGGCGQHLVERCALVTHVQRGSLCEVWVKCGSAEDVLLDIESALNRGYLLEEVAFLTGLKIKGYKISKEIIEANNTLNQSVDGEIEFEFCKPVSEWIAKLDVKKMSIDIKNRRAVAQLTKPIHIETLFDLGIRLLKPRRVPP
jgi:hypothetical protein